MITPKPTADPGRLEQLARVIRQQAQQVEHSVTGLQRAAGGAQWRGHAADLFQQDVRQDQQRAQVAAAQLRALADALDRGANEIRAYLAEIARQQAAERAQQQAARARATAAGAH